MAPRANKSIPSVSYNEIASTSSEKMVSLEQRPRRTVRFTSNDEIREIVHINELKRTIDLDDIWFSCCEYDAIKSDIIKTVEDIESGNPLSIEDQCARGLEALTVRGSLVKQQQIRSALNSVLEEQKLQRYEGINDPDLLADIFFETTHQSRFAAECVALQDRKEIFQ